MNSPFNKTPAHEAIAQHTDDIKTLKRFLDLVDDPSPLLDAHKLAREEATLTDEQLEQHGSALETIERATALRQGIIDDRSALTGDMEKHQGDVEAFNSWRKEEVAKLEALREELETGLRQVDAEKKRQETEWGKMQNEYSEKMTPIDDMRAQAAENVELTEKELDKQKGITAKLERKAKRVKEAVADDKENTEDK